MELPSGTVIAERYRVEHVLGAGAMGAVVCALDLQTSSRVAIKLLRDDALSLANAKGRFLREIRAVRGLRSRHIAAVLDAGALPDGRPYIVMEHLDGKDLSTIQKERDRLPCDEVCEYMIQACDALGEAHAAGIVHRDLKPANLFVVHLEGEAVVKVLDFGVSKVTPLEGRGVPAGGDGVITSITDVLGSPGYMAPEQLLSARDADARSDVYSLGVVMYKLVTGQPPILAKSFHEHVEKIVRGDIKKPSLIAPGSPAGFDAVVMRCLEKKASNRYQEVSQLARALRPFSRFKDSTSVERIALIARAPPSVSVLVAPPSFGSQNAAPPSFGSRSVAPSEPGVDSSRGGHRDLGRDSLRPRDAGRDSPGLRTGGRMRLYLSLVALAILGASLGAYYAMTHAPKSATSPQR